MNPDLKRILKAIVPRELRRAIQRRIGGATGGRFFLNDFYDQLTEEITLRQVLPNALALGMSARISGKSPNR